MKHIFSLCLALAFLWSINCLVAQEATETKPERGYYMPTRITVVYTDAAVIAQEGIPEWLAMAVNVVREYYPLYDKYLETEGHVPSGNVTLQAESGGAIGWNSDTTIGFSINYIKPGAAGEKDWGMIAHELVHFIQGYRDGPGTGVPGWVTEGIGDFVRHAFFEPEKEMRPVNAERASYRNAYQVSAGFLMWIAEHYDLEIVPKLNAHGRFRTYSPEVFVEYTGKSLDDLWAEYAEKILRPLNAENKHMVPAVMFPKLMAHLEKFQAHVATLSEEPRPQGQQRQGQRQPRPQE